MKETYDNILITICARGGSKGVPGKNIRKVHGKPLIGYTIECAQTIAETLKADVALSTDSTEIAAVAASFGLESAYLRPDSLAGDTAGKVDAIAHVLADSEKSNQKSYDFVIDLDVTSPLRTKGDVLTAFEMLLANQDALNIFSVSEAGRSPYFNMVEFNTEGYAVVVKQLESIKSRQAAPKVFDMNASFYIYRRQFFQDNWRTATTNRSLAYVMDHICFDLDEPNDFLYLEFLLKEGLLSFAL